MNTVDLPILRLHHHRNWVNENLLASAAALSEEQLHQNCAIGQGSIWKSLTHMWGAEYVWLEALLGNDNGVAPGDVAGKLPGNQLGEGAVASITGLRLRWARLQQRWEAYLVTLSPESLNDQVGKVSSSTGQRYSMRRMDILLHVCTHAHWTAAQTVNMMRQVGAAKLPEAMLMAMARSEAG